MKKGFKSLTAVISLVTAVSALTACGSDYAYPKAHWTEDLIATVGGKQMTFTDIYKLMEGQQESAKSYFATASDVLAQFVTPRSQLMIAHVESRLSEQKQTWKSNASTNNTSYKEEQQKTFDSEGVEDEEGLRNKWIADEQLSENKTEYALAHESETKGEENYLYQISEEETKNFTEKTRPYHVSHILVKVDAGGDGEDTYEGAISKDNAKKISNVVSGLMSSESFGETAYRLSDDSSSTSYGDLFTGDNAAPLMLSTSYVNEFKLGLYTYDAVMNGNLQDKKLNAQIRQSLRIPNTKVTENGKEASTINSSVTFDTQNASGNAFGIPLSVALTLGYEAEQEKSYAGFAVSTENNYDISANLYPRNIIFNNYFNNHEISFIYNDRDEYAEKFIGEVKSLLVAAADAHLDEDDADRETKLAATKEAVDKALPADTDGNIASSLAKIKALANKDTDAIKIKGLPSDIDLSEKYKEWISITRSLGLSPTTGLADENSTVFDEDKFQDASALNLKANLVTYKSNTVDWNDSSKENIVPVTGEKKILSYSQTFKNGDEKKTVYSPVIMTRAGTSGDTGYQGIHFIVVNNDPFGTGNAEEDKIQNSGNYQYRYYRVNKPDDKHEETGLANPFTADYEENPSIVNFLKSDLKSDASNAFYTTRIGNVTQNINSYGSNQNFKLWESNLKKFKEKYGQDFTTLLGNKYDSIKLYIEQTEASTETSDNETLDNSWKTYVNQTKLYEDLQGTRMIPTSVIPYFQYGKIPASMEVTAHVKK